MRQSSLGGDSNIGGNTMAHRLVRMASVERVYIISRKIPEAREGVYITSKKLPEAREGVYIASKKLPEAREGCT